MLKIMWSIILLSYLLPIHPHPCTGEHTCVFVIVMTLTRHQTYLNQKSLIICVQKWREFLCEGTEASLFSILGEQGKVSYTVSVSMSD